MYVFDEEVFRERRRYENRRQPLPSEDFSDGDPESTTILFRKYEQFSDSFDEGSLSGRFSWLDTINNSNLVCRLKKLKQGDLELLTLFAIEGYSQTEIADIVGCNQSVISRKLSRIKNILKKK